MKENTIEKFNDALADVRKAHRLIYSYQQRMLDLVYFIKTKFDFPEFVGVKHFSNPIANKRNGYQAIFNDMWAWDFLYSYVYEYHFGEIFLEDGSSCVLSVIQYSDTGYFEIEEENSHTDVNSFLSPEMSSSKCLFFLEIKFKAKDPWKSNFKDLIYDKKIASMKHQRDVFRDKGHIQVLYSFPLDSFLNEKTTINALQEFVKYCSEEDVVDLKIV